MIKRIHMYDIDGLLVDSTHRYRTDDSGKKIDLPFWRKNDIWSKILQDFIMPMAKHYKESLENPEIYVILATARACVVGDANYHFIQHQLGMPNKFIHRQGENDSRGGAELKINGMKQFLGLKQFKNADFHVYEDNHIYLRDVCYAMRDMGFITV